MQGWEKDISHVRKKEDLPKAAREYIDAIERALATPVTMVSVGPDREAYISMA